MPFLIDFLVSMKEALYCNIFSLSFIIFFGFLAYVITIRFVSSAAETLQSRHIYGVDINKTTQAQREAFFKSRTVSTQESTNKNEKETITESGTTTSSISHSNSSTDDQNSHEPNQKSKKEGNSSNQPTMKEDKVDISNVRLVPESLGILAGCVYLSITSIYIMVFFFFSFEDRHIFNSAFCTITVMLLLGFVDDVLDLRWRHKICLSCLGSLPLVMGYEGSTSVLIPPTVVRYFNSIRNVNLADASVGSRLLLSGVECAEYFIQTLNYILDGSTVQELSNYMNIRFFNSYAATSPASPAISFTAVKGESGENPTYLLGLGPLYLIYLSMLCIFCTNSINILAGVNGIEVGQSIVIAVASIVYNLLQLGLASSHNPNYNVRSPQNAAFSTNMTLNGNVSATNINNRYSSQSHTDSMGTINYNLHDPSSSHQIRALMLLSPFVGVSLALYKFNKYPARIFVGDSYTYFAGTVLAVAGIIGVYSKTLILFFVPQIINFLLSLPQLFNIVPCPRHRVPRWVPEKDVMTNSRNYTILNLILLIAGDMHERILANKVLALQVGTCALGFIIRYAVASWMYEKVE